MIRLLTLNVSPISFSDAEVTVGVFDYNGKEQLDKLRATYSATHVFRREAGTRILCVPVVAGATAVGDSIEKVHLSKNLPFAASLIRHALLNYLHSLGRQILAYEPIKFIAAGSAEDLLFASVPSGTSCPDWLSVRPLYEASIRVVSLDRQQSFVGMALDVRTRRAITVSCADLIAQGFPVIDQYVGRLVAKPDGRIAPRFELLGRVRTVDGKELVLDDARPGIPSVNASEAMLDPSVAVFNLCLSHAFKDKASAVKQVLVERLATFRSGPSRLDKIRKVVSHLAKQKLEMVPGVTFGFHEFLTENGGAQFPVVLDAPKTVYVFDPTGARTDTWHDRGLDDHGPYTSQSFTPTRPRICVICEQTKKGEVEQFLHKFLNGVAFTKNNRAPFGKGFVRKYALEGAATEFFPTDNGTAEAYHKAASLAVAQQTERNVKWDLALVQIEERFHELHGEANPYLITKGVFLTHQIPVQEFEMETIAYPDPQLAYVLNNMALATYAKLGGVPWLIKANPTIAHELVIGIGSAHVGKDRLGPKERIVGITTVFTGDGNYWLSNLSRAVPMDEYKDALLASLRETFGRVRRDMNWEQRDHVRLVFHVFKPLKDAEVEAVKTLTAELGEYDVEFAFLHIVEDHPYLLFDEKQNGVNDYASRRQKGVFAPSRGLFLRLSAHEVLMTLTGPREVKRPDDGMPHPILLRLHRNSTFRDTSYLAKQVFTFSSHSWRSFFPSPIPVTILYSELIAKLLGQLGTMPRWNPDVMLGRIGKTRWFL